MGFDADELAMVRTSLRHVIDTNSPADVPGALIAEGWADLVRADPAAAITALAEQAGAARSAAPVLDLAVLHGAGLATDATTAVITGGLVLAGWARAERLVNLTGTGLGALERAAVTMQPARGLDPALGAHRATFDAAAAPVAGQEAAQSALATGRRALASQMVGASEQMLVDTLAYVSDRHQYGRAIGSFQSVKHRLADVKVAITAARAGVRTAWDHADGPDGPTSAMAAKCLAGRAHHLASTHCFQVHGGIAFTVEHGFQQWVRRGLLLDHLLGGHEQLTRELGAHLIATATIPRVPELSVPDPKAVR